MTGSLWAQRIPFILPWNDSTNSITDFSTLNRPISNSRVTADTNGHFIVDGQRVRFLGMNFAGDSPFTPTNKAEAVAARLAKFGVNVVRFHHMDAPWAYGGGLLSYGTSSTNFNRSQLDRLQYLVWRLKTHGVYSDVNLLVGREYRAGDGLGSEVTTMDFKDQHALGYFYEPALALQKDYATKLLAAANPFTSLSLAEDPAVAFVEIINENGFIAKWLDGGLDRLPTRYAAPLQARWNTWLSARCADDAALLSAWGVVNQPLGSNLLKNGGFTNGLTYWNTEQHDTARAGFTRTLDFNGLPSARIAVTNPAAVDWYIQFNQANLSLISNQVYTISFWAKANMPTNASAAVMRAHTDYAVLGYSQNLSLTTNWQQFTNTFQSAVRETNARVNFGGMGNKAATFWFADVRFQTGGQLGTLPNGATLASRTIPAIRYSGPGYTGTRQARSDWLSFLREAENAYYDAMVAHIRSLGYDGLIFGTIMANSPATVQSRLDVIDGHAYWQHPQFPGRPWDASNWYQPNISMVNTLGSDNTLAGLARQRIAGKPFTVTEYQHPSPNYYGAEGPLLLAAYAALQDWDGLWLFDYGQGSDVAPMGYVRSYFDTAQHPTKMANLLLAANIFRRGDVRPATYELTMGLTPERELGLLANAGAWSVFSSSQLGVSGKLAFTNRLSTRVGTNASGLPTAPPAPSGSTITSDTRELRWNLSDPAKGLVTVDSPRTKALAGFCDNRAVSLGNLLFQPGTTSLGWCTLGATLVRGEVFTNDCNFLLVATGWWENSGQVWTDSTKTSLGTKWGQAPVLTEVVPFTVTLPVGTNFVHAWTLNVRGQRLAPVPVFGTTTNSTISVNTNAGSIWYEVEVERWMASFDLWRARYFAATELALPEISGEAAAPDGDGVPNLLKYYLGLPGKMPVPSGRVPFGGVRNIGGQLYPALTYTRDKLAQDVLCTGQSSDDLRAWLSTPPWILDEITDLGQIERVRYRDGIPLAGSRFLRLALERF